MATVEKELFTFPGPPEADQVEWPGTAIGEANVITKTKARTLVSDKAVDASRTTRNRRATPDGFSVFPGTTPHPQCPAADNGPVISEAAQRRAVTNAPDLPAPRQKRRHPLPPASWSSPRGRRRDASVFAGI